METLYTPYGLPLMINHHHSAKSNTLSVQISTTNKNNFDIIKDNLLRSFKSAKGIEKLKKKLCSTGVSAIQITQVHQKNVIQLCLVVDILHKKVQTYSKVIKIVLELLLRKFPKYVEEAYGIERVLHLYDDIRMKVTLSGSFNIAKAFRIFRSYRTYIGLKY